VLILATLAVLRALRNVLRQFSPAREELSFTAEHDFPLERVIALLHDERAELHGLEREQGERGDRVALIVRFPPRYRAERFVESLSQVPGVREVQWEGG